MRCDTGIKRAASAYYFCSCLGEENLTEIPLAVPSEREGEKGKFGKEQSIGDCCSANLNLLASSVDGLPNLTQWR